uniref:hypothetical protein n=1 Tax=Listeria ivanovii TaxID=1638 RepID=UPI0018EC211C|nr:hypothetical protein [Listeria ivanovii]
MLQIFFTPFFWIYGFILERFFLLSVFEENDLQEEKVFKAVAYAFVVGLTQN